jgi:hypothetical protein
MTVKSVLHKLAEELNRPNLHDEIEETEAEFEERTKPVVSELDQLKQAVADLQRPQAPVTPVVEPVKEVEPDATA